MMVRSSYSGGWAPFSMHLDRRVTKNGGLLKVWRFMRGFKDIIQMEGFTLISTRFVQSDSNNGLPNSLLVISRWV
uniref:Uncharacterized protein n=1 Tax=Cannabis sativa TaxID=3483 RepID=A0A803R898_CANSA